MVDCSYPIVIHYYPTIFRKITSYSPINSSPPIQYLIISHAISLLLGLPHSPTIVSWVFSPPSRPRRWPQRYRALPRFGAAPVAWVARVSHGAASPAQGIEKYLDITSHIRWIILDISMDDYIPYRLHIYI
jgi:hypothetical protein